MYSLSHLLAYNKYLSLFPAPKHVDDDDSDDSYNGMPPLVNSDSDDVRPLNFLREISYK